MILLLFFIFCIIPDWTLAADNNSFSNFRDLVEQDQGIPDTEKKKWVELAKRYIDKQSFSFDYSSLLFAIFSQAKFDEVNLEIAAKVGLNCIIAVQNGAPEEEITELALYAFGREFTIDELVLFASVTHKCTDAGVPLNVTQEMIRHAKEENWSASSFTTIMDGLIQASRHGVNMEKVALFMLISIAQNRGSPEQIVKDALDDARKREPQNFREDGKAPLSTPEPPQLKLPKIALNYDVFRRSVESFLGTPYVWGGSSKDGTDCSGFTNIVMRESGYQIPRVSRDQAQIGKEVKVKDLRLGDLVFYDTKGKNEITHVGIYLGGNIMAHASSSKGVIIVMFDDSYFRSRYMGARRIVSYTWE